MSCTFYEYSVGNKSSESLNFLLNETANDLRNKIAATLLHQKPHNSNLTKNELYALKQLKNNKAIIITRADKGNTTVTINKSDYEKKAREHLQDGLYELIKVELRLINLRLKLAES
ncbi:unnamed protein product [Schistosoma curassoni]|nr:unnamed protein product [Schistosoma curassoni]